MDKKEKNFLRICIKKILELLFLIGIMVPALVIFGAIALIIAIPRWIITNRSFENCYPKKFTEFTDWGDIYVIKLFSEGG